MRAISRSPRRTRSEVRRALGLPEKGPIITVSMGGYGERMPFLRRLGDVPDTTLLVIGQAETRREGDVLYVERIRPLFMPDLLRASDALVAKLGYGVIAEAWREGISIAYVPRPDSPEMPALVGFARTRLPGLEVAAEAFGGGAWLDRLPLLLDQPRAPRPEGGAEEVVGIVEEAVR